MLVTPRYPNVLAAPTPVWQRTVDSTHSLNTAPNRIILLHQICGRAKKAAQRQAEPWTLAPRSTVEEPDEPKWLTSGFEGGWMVARPFI